MSCAFNKSLIDISSLKNMCLQSSVTIISKGIIKLIQIPRPNTIVGVPTQDQYISKQKTYFLDSAFQRVSRQLLKRGVTQVEGTTSGRSHHRAAAPGAQSVIAPKRSAPATS